MRIIIPLIEANGSLRDAFMEGAAMDTAASECREMLVDKDKFDSVLKRMINSKPLPLKDVIGTSPRGKRAEAAS